MHSQQQLPMPASTSPACSGQSIRHLPITLFGAVMSIASLSLAWRLAAGRYGAPLAVSNAIGGIALAAFAAVALAYLLKAVLHPALVMQEFRHPIVGNFFGTIGIGILLLSSVIQPWHGGAQIVVWLIGALATLSVSAAMITRLLGGNGAPASVTPPWLIAGVGSLNIVVAGGAFSMQWAREINLLAAGVGGVSALVFFTMIFSRLVHHEPLAAGMRPAKMILVAPFAVGFIAYVRLTGQVDMFAGMLFHVALFLFAVVGYRLLRQPAPFSQAWWAIGFPIAALSNAALLYADAAGGWPLSLIAIVLLALISATVLVLFAATVRALVTGRLLAG